MSEYRGSRVLGYVRGDRTAQKEREWQQKTLKLIQDSGLKDGQKEDVPMESTPLEEEKGGLERRLFRDGNEDEIE